MQECREEIVRIILKAGRYIRQLKGLPEEENITTLYEETSIILGIPTIPTKTQNVDHLPAPHKMKSPDGRLIIPLRKCPKCEKDAMQIFGLCPTCKDSEGGKYRTKFVCNECQYADKSEKHMVTWLQEMGVDFGNQPKKELGIKTITDDGVK